MSSAGASSFLMNSTTCLPPHLRHRHIEYLHVRQHVDDVLRGVGLSPRTAGRAPVPWPLSNSTCGAWPPDIEHLINVLQLVNHNGKRPKGICNCAMTGMSTTCTV